MAGLKQALQNGRDLWNIGPYDIRYGLSRQGQEAPFPSHVLPYGPLFSNLPLPLWDTPEDSSTRSSWFSVVVNEPFCYPDLPPLIGNVDQDQLSSRETVSQINFSTLGVIG